MENYIHSDFYNTQKLTLKTKENILVDAKSKAYDWRVDILDCNVSFARKRIEMSFEEIMSKLSNNAHFTIIHRKGYKPKNQDDKDDIWRWKLEIAFSTYEDPAYFLWIFMEENELEYFIKKYDLKLL